MEWTWSVIKHTTIVCDHYSIVPVSKIGTEIYNDKKTTKKFTKIKYLDRNILKIYVLKLDVLKMFLGGTAKAIKL